LAGLVTVLGLVGALVVYNLLAFTPRQLDTFTGWYSIDRSGVELVERAGVENAVVFVEQRAWTDFAPFFSANSPKLDTSVVYAIDHGNPSNRRLLRDFPGRSVWRYRDGELTRVGE
jgi:hypothetical protein